MIQISKEVLIVHVVIIFTCIGSILGIEWMISWKRYSMILKSMRANITNREIIRTTNEIFLLRMVIDILYKIGSAYVFIALVYHLTIAIRDN